MSLHLRFLLPISRFLFRVILTFFGYLAIRTMSTSRGPGPLLLMILLTLRPSMSFIGWGPDSHRLTDSWILSCLCSTVFSFVCEFQKMFMNSKCSQIPKILMNLKTVCEFKKCSQISKMIMSLKTVHKFKKCLQVLKLFNNY